MIIVIAGMKRSGSTWQYNVIRLYIEEATGEKPIITGTPDEALAKEEECPEKLILCKYHPWNRELSRKATMIFSSNRKWGEAMESLSRFKGEAPKIERQKSMKDWHQSWQEVADFCMEFTAFQADPKLMIHIIGLELYEHRIIPSFNINLRDEVRVSMEELTPPSREEYYDEETLLFWNHVTDKRHRR